MSDIDLNAPEVQAAIKQAVKEANEKAESEREALAAKRDELLSEVKKLKRGREIDPADVEALEKQLDDLRAENSDLKKAAKKHATDLETANKRAESAEQFGTGLLVDNALTDALVKAGVTNPVHQKAAKALLRDQVAIVADGDKRVAKVGEKSVADHITEWAGGDEGKHFVTASDANGGGSHGGRPNPNNSGGKLPDVSDKAGRAALFKERLAAATE